MGTHWSIFGLGLVTSPPPPSASPPVVCGGLEGLCPPCGVVVLAVSGFSSVTPFSSLLHGFLMICIHFFSNFLLLFFVMIGIGFISSRAGHRGAGGTQGQEATWGVRGSLDPSIWAGWGRRPGGGAPGNPEP